MSCHVAICSGLAAIWKAMCPSACMLEEAVSYLITITGSSTVQSRYWISRSDTKCSDRHIAINRVRSAFSSDSWAFVYDGRKLINRKFAPFRRPCRNLLLVGEKTIETFDRFKCRKLIDELRAVIMCLGLEESANASRNYVANPNSTGCANNKQIS